VFGSGESRFFVPVACDQGSRRRAEKGVKGPKRVAKLGGLARFSVACVSQRLDALKATRSDDELRWGFFCIASGPPVGACVDENPRGSSAIGCNRSCHRLYAVGSFNPDHGCSHAAIGGRSSGPGGPILSGRQSSARFEYRLLATSESSVRQFVLKGQRERRMVLEWYACSGQPPFRNAGRKTDAPSSGSPAVTKRQSAMISLACQRDDHGLAGVPLRPVGGAGRDYHNASALSFPETSESARRGWIIGAADPDHCRLWRALVSRRRAPLSSSGRACFKPAVQRQAHCSAVHAKLAVTGSSLDQQIQPFSNANTRTIRGQAAEPFAWGARSRCRRLL